MSFYWVGHFKKQGSSYGFTIVELLIVVVVIAILAAITIVAYSGISRQATVSMLQSGLSSGAKALKTYQVESATYPATLAGINNGQGLPSRDGVLFEYSVNNSVNPQTFCLTATSNGISYYVDQEGRAPSEGLCPGHTGIAEEEEEEEPPLTFETLTFQQLPLHGSVTSSSHITSSADGLKLAITNAPGYIYTSTDGGATWTERSSSGSQPTWLSIDSSADGNTIAAIGQNRVYVSVDSGATWTTNSGAQSWRDVVVSADGTKIVAVTTDRIWYSHNSGVSWASSASSSTWQSVAMSDDGNRVTAVRYPGKIAQSTDGGVTWTYPGGATYMSGFYWFDVASSASGSVLFAKQYDNVIYRSTNSGGTTWAALPGTYWSANARMTVSADGSKVVVTATSGNVYVSKDTGATWTQHTITASSWLGAASSADGSKVYLVGGTRFAKGTYN